MFSKVALVTTIENNIENKNSKFLNKERLYFDEALECFKSWNKYMPEVKKYAICPTKATLNSDEIKILEDLNVTYIEKYFSETESFKNGFINVALSTAYLEDILIEDIFIHTDLDMILLRRLPESLISGLENFDVMCGKYDENARKDQRVDFDTGFTISLRQSKFYNYYWDIIRQFLNGIRELPEGVLYYDIEEYAMEKISEDPKSPYNIISILKYQVGEGYPSVDTFLDSEVKDIYFWHEHKINDKKEELVKEKIKLFKRIRNG